MRYLIVGLGNVGEKRKRILADRCVATVDPYQCQTTYSSHLSVPIDSYDAVVVATPNEVKLQYLSYFLAAGKHVLVEKPLLFPDSETALALSALANRSGTIWYTNYNHRFEPHVVKMKELLENQFVGSVYRARFVYGNGTVQNIIGSWREGGYGVLEDLGCHLLDFIQFLLEYDSNDFKVCAFQKLESRCFDHCIFSTGDNKIYLKCSWTMWKNTFNIDVFGSRGSIHMNGLCKWGPTELITRRRVLPSGVPEEIWQTTSEPDRLWECDLDEFERRVRDRQSSYANDVRISHIVRRLAGEWEGSCRA